MSYGTRARLGVLTIKCDRLLPQFAGESEKPRTASVRGFCKDVGSGGCPQIYQSVYQWQWCTNSSGAGAIASSSRGMSPQSRSNLGTEPRCIRCAGAFCCQTWDEAMRRQPKLRKRGQLHQAPRQAPTIHHLQPTPSRSQAILTARNSRPGASASPAPFLASGAQVAGHLPYHHPFAVRLLPKIMPALGLADLSQPHWDARHTMAGKNASTGPHGFGVMLGQPISVTAKLPFQSETSLFD